MRGVVEAKGGEVVQDLGGRAQIHSPPAATQEEDLQPMEVISADPRRAESCNRGGPCRRAGRSRSAAGG
jgi:hypothetical protein